MQTPPRDTLFVLRPGFEDPAASGKIWFCPYSAQVIGFLTYYPAVRASLDLIELGFGKPREPLATMLGPTLQAPPMLVLGAGAPREAPDGVTLGEVGALRYVEKTKEILRYLAATRDVPPPH